MKSFLLYIFAFTILIFSNTYSQDIKAKLAGHSETNGFTVVDDADKVLFKVSGNGNVGINTSTPTGILDVQGGITDLGTGKGINLVAASTSDYGPGGNMLLKAGNGRESGGNISILSGSANTGSGNGGSINISSGVGSVGGDISINTGPTGNYNTQSGSISIYTANNTEGHAGSIDISTGSSQGDFGNSITLKTGGANVGNSITFKTGPTIWGAGDIILEVDPANSFAGEGNILLNPHIGGGLVKINGSGTYTGTWTQVSDERFKRDIDPLHNSLDKIQQLNGVSYEFRSKEFPEKNFSDGKQIGLIAQDVEKVFPELVKTDNEGYKSVAYQNMVAVLIEAVKEQQQNIDELKKEVELLKSSIYSKKVEVSTVGN